MVGVMAEVGRGGLGAADAERFLREASEVPARLTAPPSGLFLVRGLYEGDPPPGPLRAVLLLGGERGGWDAPPEGEPIG